MSMGVCARQLIDVKCLVARLEEEVAPHAKGVDVALAAFGVGKGSAKMPEEEAAQDRSRQLAGFLPRRQGWAHVCAGL